MTKRKLFNPCCFHCKPTPISVVDFQCAICVYTFSRARLQVIMNSFTETHRRIDMCKTVVFYKLASTLTSDNKGPWQDLRKLEPFHLSQNQQDSRISKMKITIVFSAWVQHLTDEKLPFPGQSFPHPLAGKGNILIIEPTLHSISSNVQTTCITFLDIDPEVLSELCGKI